MRTWAHVLFLVGLACCAAAAQDAMSRVPAKYRSLVSGKVVDAVTGRPLARAWVNLRGLRSLPFGPHSRVVAPGDYQTMTDAHGDFIVPQIYPGQYVLSAGLLGYVSHNYNSNGRKWPPARLTVEPSSKVDGLLIRLVPTGGIRERITDENGKPMPWRTTDVLALRIGYDIDGNKRLTGVGTYRTWGMGPGGYSLWGLSPGTYYLETQYRNHVFWDVPKAMWPRVIAKLAAAPRTPKDPNYAYPPVFFYPGTMKLTDATRVTIAAGQKISGIDFVIPAIRAYTVSGRVTALSATKPKKSQYWINISLQSGSPYLLDSGLSRQGIVQSGGRFEIRRVIPGSYVLWASEFQNGSWAVARLAVVVKDADVRGLNLVIRPTIELTGRLRVAGREGPPAGGFVISLTPVEQGPFGFVKADMHPDGTFEIKGLNSIPYRLEVGMPHGDYLESVRLGTQEALAKPVEIEPGGASGSLSVTVGLRGGRVRGTVYATDHQPASGAVVALVPDPPYRGALELYKSTGADQNGRFALSGIRPGGYELFAWEGVPSGAWRNPDFLWKVDGKGRRIELLEGERKALQLQVLRPERDSSAQAP